MIGAMRLCSSVILAAPVVDNIWIIGAGSRSPYGGADRWVLHAKIDESTMAAIGNIGNMPDVAFLECSVDVLLPRAYGLVEVCSHWPKRVLSWVRFIRRSGLNAGKLRVCLAAFTVEIVRTHGWLMQMKRESWRRAHRVRRAGEDFIVGCVRP
ncbi:hypothetical protein DN412_26455 [Cupriavidus lacunae]|uniref:Uncharacterized protein n=1 Tax=Cupriavidus lacunae TaxID=2666307 RepID=A0A370NP22_9BURK|nr:hypothetical protein DN412_26455 [Cupriavidus lacunae]